MQANLRGLRGLREASKPVTDCGVLVTAARYGALFVCGKARRSPPVAWGIVRPVLLVPMGFEALCDDRVLASGGKPSVYAKLVLDWDARPGMDALIAVGIANRSWLKRCRFALTAC